MKNNRPFWGMYPYFFGNIMKHPFIFSMVINHCSPETSHRIPCFEKKPRQNCVPNSPFERPFSKKSSRCFFGKDLGKHKQKTPPLIHKKNGLKERPDELQVLCFFFSTKYEEHPSFKLHIPGVRPSVQEHLVWCELEPKRAMCLKICPKTDGFERILQKGPRNYYGTPKLLRNYEAILAIFDHLKRFLEDHPS